MRNILTILILTFLVGLSAAVTITDPTYNYGPYSGFTNPGTIKCSDLYATDDLKVGDDAQIIDDLAVGGDQTTTGNLTVSGAGGITGDITGNVTATGTVQAEQLTSTDDINATGTVYAADVVTSDDATIGDDLSVAGHTDLDSLVVAGTARLNTTIIATGDTVTVTDADGLTVGGKIVPQEIVVTWPLSASSVDESVFIPTESYNVTAVEIRYSVAASSGPTNVTLKKCTVGEAPASGDAITSAMLLNGTVNTVYSYTPIVGSEGITAADTLCLDYSGTMTALAGGTVTITLERV